MGLYCPVRNKILYVLFWWTVYVLTWVIFWVISVLWSYIWLWKISISAETEVPGDHFITPIKHFWLRVFSASLCDSCGFTDINTHFAAPWCRFYFKINCWPIVTSSIHELSTNYCDITMTDGSPVFSMDTFFTQWHWGQWVNTSVMLSFSGIIIERICGALNNGSDYLATMGQHEFWH